MVVADASYTPPVGGFRTFVILWATQSLSTVGGALTLFAANIWLTQTRYARPEERSALAFAIAATSLAYAIPRLVGAPLAGAWADRHDRKRTMLGADLLSGVFCAALALLLATGTLNLPSLGALMALISAVGTFHYAAFDTSYAMLVPEGQLSRANAMMRTMEALSSLFAPALAATLIALPALARAGTVPLGALGRFADGTALAVGLDGVTFLIAALALLFLFIPSPAPLATEARGAARNLRADVRAGFGYIGVRRPLLWLLAAFAVANLTATPTIVLVPLLVKFDLAADWGARGLNYETALALLNTALGVGGVAGGIVISVWGGLKRRRIVGVLVPMLVAGLAQLAFGLSATLALSAACLAVIALASVALNVHSQTIWQAQTPRALQGRVFAARRLIAQGSAPLATALTGVFAGLFDPRTVVAACGALLALYCFVQFGNRTLLRVEDRAWVEELAAARAGR